MPVKKAKAHASNSKKAAPAKAAKPSAGGAIGSLKKILGLGGSKGAPAKAAKGAKPAPKTLAKPVKGAKSAPVPAPVLTKAGKGAAAPIGKKGAAAATAKVEAPLKPLGKKAGKDKAGRPSREALYGGAPVCREVACELMSTTGGYCRMHYIKNWKKIKRKEMILKEKKLNSYIEELVSKYPDKYIEAIRQDLASEKDFAKVIADLEIEEGMDDFESVDTESAEGIIDNLKRDFEDDGDVF